jgi:hypothetical protein
MVSCSYGVRLVGQENFRWVFGLGSGWICVNYITVQFYNVNLIMTINVNLIMWSIIPNNTIIW